VLASLSGGGIPARRRRLRLRWSGVLLRGAERSEGPVHRLEELPGAWRVGGREERRTLEQAGRGVMESIQAMPTGRLLQELRETLLALGAKRTDGVLQARADQLEEEVLRRMAW
jgi:hypothetical protein